MTQHRSSQRYEPAARSDEKQIVSQMHAIVRRHPRYGYRRVWALLKRGGFGRLNVKRVHRLWRKEGFRVPVRKVKKRRIGTSANGIMRRKSERKNQVWSWDFIFDRTENGSTLKWLSVVDEFTRECLALKVGRSLRGVDVIDVLIELSKDRGMPSFIRSDNGPEFIAANVRKWIEIAGGKTLYVEPGSPWENGFVESFHGRLRDELLDAELFGSVAEARMLSDQWRREYNHERPHSALGYATPAAFAAECEEKSKTKKCDAADEYIGDRCAAPLRKTPAVQAVSSGGGQQELTKCVKLS
jgi:transposase InsO family protein